MKRILAVLLTAVLLTLTGCSGELTAEEYRASLSECVQAYSRQQIRIAVEIAKGEETDWDTLKTYVSDGRAALDETSQLNPPVEYSGQHKAICEAMSPEKLWLDAIEKVADNGGFTDELVQEVLLHVSDSEYYDYVIATLKRMRDDGVSSTLF